jgi:hypothetical protein
MIEHLYAVYCVCVLVVVLNLPGLVVSNSNGCKENSCQLSRCIYTCAGFTYIRLLPAACCLLLCCMHTCMLVSEQYYHILGLGT